MESSCPQGWLRVGRLIRKVKDIFYVEKFSIYPKDIRKPSKDFFVGKSIGNDMIRFG